MATATKDYEELTLDSDVFSSARSNFDLLMQELLEKMKTAESEEGSITLKVDLTLIEDLVDKSDGTVRVIRRPVIKHKVTTSVPLKNSLDSKNDIRMDLQWDDELQRYVLKNITGGTQRSIFDPDFEDTLKSDGDEEQRGNALPGPNNALPAPESNDEPIDTDFIDVPDEEPDMGADEAESGDYDYDEPTEEGEEDEE